MPSVHRQTFVDLVQQHGWTRGAELGVDKGILFGMLLRECPNVVSLIGVDTFPDRQRSQRAFQYSMLYQDRAWLLEMPTREGADRVADRELDFVFIDADHGYEAVKEDIALWKPKVRAGGWLGGHDYHARKFPGVVQAVNEAFAGKHHELPGTIWGVWV